ncbi:von Willebrand factor A domain-containing protein 9 [Armadillidium vulgare]|nr:von Willebrand factor A domain-containing protein 9 [Armadillidium vulgare]
MPTVLLLDVSLSMCQPVFEDIGIIGKSKPLEENGDVILRKNLSVMGCNQILDHFSQYCKLEFTALIIFSSLYEVVVRFTRDFDSVKGALSTLEDYDKTNIQVGLLGVTQHILEEWGNGTPCQIVLISDGNLGTQQGVLSKSLASLQHGHGPSELPLPFPFPAKLHIVCIASPDDEALKSVSSMFEKLIAENFMPYNGTIHCGNLSASIMLSPPPQQYHRHHDFETVRESVKEEIHICGFLNVADVSSPPAFSRHLVLSMVNKVTCITESFSDDLATFAKDSCSDDEGVIDEARIPSLCVLLHGGLKKGNMVALCQVGNNWFGIFYSWADSKKKSNLMLSIFEPGYDVIPWLGKLSNLGPVEALSVNPYGQSNTTSPFPLKVPDKKSYAQNCVVWVRHGGLQSDVQKILRHARKLPDKHASFYKELNRVRKAALMYGFPELLNGLANLLERECYNLPSSTHP